MTEIRKRVLGVMSPAPDGFDVPSGKYIDTGITSKLSYTINTVFTFPDRVAFRFIFGVCNVNYTSQYHSLQLMSGALTPRAYWMNIPAVIEFVPTVGTVYDATLSHGSSKGTLVINGTSKVTSAVSGTPAQCNYVLGGLNAMGNVMYNSGPMIRFKKFTITDPASSRTVLNIVPRVKSGVALPYDTVSGRFLQLR